MDNGVIDSFFRSAILLLQSAVSVCCMVKVSVGAQVTVIVTPFTENIIYNILLQSYCFHLG